MVRYTFVILLVLGLVACAPASAATAISSAAPTIQASQTPPIPLPSNWAGAIVLTDGTIESIKIQLAASGGTFNIEPFTKTYAIEELQWKDATISFSVVDQNDLHFSGDFDGSQITGQVKANSQTNSFTLLPLYPMPKDLLNDFPGTYQLDSGTSLLINLAPEYSSSGLYFFGQGLMLTHFGTGAIRALFPVAPDTFLVGSARAIGYPFSEQITFTRELKWKRDGPDLANA